MNAYSPAYRIVWEVLEAAKDASDARMVAKCRQWINARRIGQTIPGLYAEIMEFRA